MFWQAFSYFIAILFVSAGIMDLIKREIPDWLAYMILAISIVFFILTGNYNYFKFISIAVALLLGLALYLLGTWALGDLLILTSSAFIVPNIVALLLITFSFSALFMIYYALIYGYLRNLYQISFTSVLRALAALLLIVFLFLYGKFYYILIPPIAAMFSFCLFLPEILRFQQNSYYIAKPEELMEGDWILEPIKRNGKVIVPKRNIGLTKKDIEKIKKLQIKVKVKRGIPLIPGLIVAPVLFLL
jgi:hypothetical protein